MLHYLVRRVALGLLTLLLITFVVYALIRHIPGTPLTADPAMMNPGKMPSPAEIKRLNHLYGLDKPWYEAYFVWLGNAVQLNFGRSIPKNNQAVVSLILERVPRTLLLSATSLVLTYLLSIPLGLWATVRSGSTAERTVSTVLYMLYSLPAFVAALYLAAAVLHKAPLAAAVRHDERQFRHAVDRWQGLGSVQARAVADHMLHLRQPGLLCALHSRQHARSDPARLHSHGPGERRAAVARDLASRISQHADPARDAAWPHAARTC